ncbi:hypothetical protein DFH09DRAFT_933487, partial [Mycena vulgaris]
ICNCANCHKITPSMFASSFTVADTHLTHMRGRENFTTYIQSRTIAKDNTMTNYFCQDFYSTCGSLMYCLSSGFPGISFLRLGTVDNFNLHETRLKLIVEQCVETDWGGYMALRGSSRLKGCGT